MRVVLALLCLAAIAAAQCPITGLDPAVPNPPLTFCDAFSQTDSCCVAEEAEYFEGVSEQIENEYGDTLCAAYFNAWLCDLSCDPDTIDYVEGSSYEPMIRTCKTFCSDFYAACQYSWDYYYSTYAIPSDMSEDEFCTLISSDQELFYWADSDCYDPPRPTGSSGGGHGGQPGHSSGSKPDITGSCPLTGLAPSVPDPPLTYCEDYNEMASCCVAEEATFVTGILDDVWYRYGDGKCASSIASFACDTMCSAELIPYVRGEAYKPEIEMCLSYCEVIYKACKGSEDSDGNAVVPEDVTLEQWCNSFEADVMHMQNLFTFDPSDEDCYTPSFLISKLSLGLGVLVGAFISIICGICGCIFYCVYSKFCARPTEAYTLQLDDADNDMEGYGVN